MKKLMLGIFALGMLLFASCNKLSESGVIEVAFADLPLAVQDNAEDLFPETIVTGAYMINENGENVYDLDFDSEESITVNKGGLEMRGGHGNGRRPNGGKAGGCGRHGKGGNHNGHGHFISPDSLAQNVKDYFATNFAGYTIKGGHAETLCNGTAAIAVFASNSTERVLLVFNTAGEYLMKLDRVVYTDVPQAIKDYVTATFPNGTSSEKAVKMTLADGTIQYGVRVKDGTSRIRLLMSDSGTEICRK